MRLFLLILLQAVLVTACSSPSTPTQASPMPAAPAAELTLAQLSSAATALQVVYDQALDGNPTKVLDCSISGEEAMGLMMPLKARLDEKLAQEVKVYESKPQAYGKEHAFASCQETCRCGTYAQLLESAHTRQKGALRQELKKLSFKAKQQTPAQALKCARDQGWLCESPLLRELRAEAAANQ